MENISVQDVNYVVVPENQEYTPKDESILNSVFIIKNFGYKETDYIENYVYSPSNELLASNYNFTNYSVELTYEGTTIFNQLTLTPENDVKSQGINQGSVNSIYYFYRKLLGSSPSSKFLLKTISTDRTELRVVLLSVSVDDLEGQFINWSNEVNSRNYFSDFVLNFGNNNTLIGVNIAYETSNIPTLLIKLYEPLPAEYSINDSFWLVEEISDPITYEVTIEQEFINIVEFNQLRGPNITIDIEEKPNLSTPPTTLASLRSTEVTSSLQQLVSLFDETSADINIEYEMYSGSTTWTAFENFVHFSSAEERLTNFRYKLSLIETYQAEINTLNSVGSVPYISESKFSLQGKLDEVIKNFDNYEYFLYYTSASSAWPKINNSQPYQLYPISDPVSLTWYGDSTYGSQYYGGQILSASVYDNNNPNYVWNTMPLYVTTDPQNTIIQLFISMLGQHYDYLWTYIRAITDIQIADNRLEHGISKDLVSTALQSFGIKLYGNNRNNEDIYTAFLGVTPSGSLIPSTGSLLITNYVTASNQTTPDSDLVAEGYKRLYHNLPLLLKAKGTYNGLRALMNCFGIPSTLLRIDEYGGVNKDTSQVQQYFERFAFQTDFQGVGNINVPWLPSMAQFIDTGNPNVMPDAIEFRLKTPGIPASDIIEPVFQVGADTDFRFGIQLAYSQSYNNFVSGTITSPASPYYNQRLGGNFQEYGLMKLVMSGSQGYCYSDPIYLPLFNKGWWSILLYRQNGSADNISDNTYWVIAKNSIYQGEDGSTIGFQASSSIYVMGAISSSYNNSWNYYDSTPVVSASLIPLDAYLGGTGSNNILAPNGVTFTGSFQDLRYWRNELGLESFNKHVLNPMSIQNNEYSGSTDSYNDLVFRLGLGNDLMATPNGLNFTGSRYNVDAYGNAYYATASYTSSAAVLQSIHPAITGTVATTASFVIPYNPASYNINMYGVYTYDLTLSGSAFNYNGSYYSGSYYTGSTSYHVFALSYGVNNSGSAGDTTYYALLNEPNVGAITTVNDKIRVVEQNLVTGSTLSPFITITQPQLNPFTPDLPYVDVSLSPQNSIDYDIINQLGYWSIDDYIGDPLDANSTFYQRLATLRNYYFKKYIQKYSVTDIMRLLGYFDNSLFKMIKDWVPGRASLASGVIIRPNILERVKMQRFEPDFYTGSYYTGSIPMVDITASYGYQEDRITFNYDYTTAAPNVPTTNSVTSTFTTASGIYIYNVDDQMSPYNGEYGGSQISVYHLPTSSMVMGINNLDFLDMPLADQIPTAISYSILPFLPTLNTVQSDRKSTQRLDVDYSSNPNIAVNNSFITGRYDGGLTGSTAAPADSQLALALSQQSSSFLNASSQDSNYTMKPLIDSRYNGIKLIAQQYNTYSVGDISYGNSPVISKNSIYFAYFKEVVGTGSCMAISASALPYISNVYTKYLIDAQSNVLELTKQNKNVFSIQEIFNNQQAVISLFNNQQPSKQVFLDGLQNIYAGGFRYTPVLYNPYGESTLNYSLTTSVVQTVPAAGEGGMYNTASAPSVCIIPGSPGISSSTYYSNQSGYLGGYYDVGATVYPTFSLQRTGDLATTYIDKAVNVYVKFTGSLNFTAYFASQDYYSPAYISVSPSYTLVNFTSGSDVINDNSAFAQGQFYGDALITIPAYTNQVEYDGTGIYINAYADVGGNTSFSPPFVNLGFFPRSLDFSNAGGPGNAYAITSQSTSTITQIISGAVDTGYGSNTFFKRDTGSFNILTGSVSMSYWYGQFIQSESAASLVGGYERIEEVYNIQKGDLFRFYNKESNQFDKSFEREVKGVNIPTKTTIENSGYTQAMTIEFDDQIDPRSCQDWTTTANNDTAYQVSKFIIMRKLPDETNITLNYQKQPGLTSDGIIIPADAPTSLRDQAGNIVKQLKAQNLI